MFLYLVHELGQEMNKMNEMVTFQQNNQKQTNHQKPKFQPGKFIGLSMQTKRGVLVNLG